MTSVHPTGDMARCHRRGFGLVELIVALTVFAIGILGLAGAAVLAHRSFNEADGIERAARVAEILLDSLVRADTVADGEVREPGFAARWTVAQDSAIAVVTLRVELSAGAGTRELEFSAARVDGW
jgi:prepilin-type N-terminal cleavage/methylation domain-containing protein